MSKSKRVQNLLELVPVRRFPSEQRKDGLRDIVIPRYGEGVVGRILSAILKDTPIRFNLDKIGSRTWELCDGSRTVQDIGRTLEYEFGSDVEPVYDRLGSFFKKMEIQRLISWKPRRVESDEARRV